MLYMKPDGILVRKKLAIEDIWGPQINQEHEPDIRQDQEIIIHTLSCNNDPYFQCSHFEEIQVEIFNNKVSGYVKLTFQQFHSNLSGWVRQLLTTVGLDGGYSFGHAIILSTFLYVDYAQTVCMLDYILKKTLKLFSK